MKHIVIGTDKERVLLTVDTQQGKILLAFLLFLFFLLAFQHLNAKILFPQCQGTQ